MAAFKICLANKTPSKKGEYRVSIRLNHHSMSTYIATEVRVSKSQLDKNYNVKDHLILSELNKTILK